MTIEKRIEDLQRQLAVKTAFLAAKVNFGNLSKSLSKDVLEEVTNKLKEVCTQLAEGIEVAANTPQSALTAEEVTILKQLADRVLKAASKSPEPVVQAVNAAPERPVKVVPKAEEPLMGQVMLMDNVDATMRPRLEPQCTVRVISMKQDLFFVQDNNHNRFWIPKDDLQLIGE